MVTAEGIERVPSDWPHRELSRSVRTGTLDWHVQVGGSGPVVLLLHGTGASAHSFADVVTFLLSWATVIVPDLPGHGFTRGASMSSLTLPVIAQNLDALLRVLGMPQVALVAGHSAGVPLAMRWALAQASQPGEIVGFNSALIAPPSVYTQLIAPVLVPFATSGLVAGAVARLGASTGMVDRLLDSTGSRVPSAQRARYQTLFRDPSHVRGAMGLMAAADLPRLLQEAGRLSGTTTFVLGSKDTWIPQAAQRRVIERCFAGANVLTWPGGHLLHEVEPERAALLLRERVTASAG